MDSQKNGITTESSISFLDTGNRDVTVTVEKYYSDGKLRTGMVKVNLPGNNSSWETEITDLTTGEALAIANGIFYLLAPEQSIVELELNRIEQAEQGKTRSERINDIESPSPSRFVHRIGDSQNFSE